jgi:hypothetical protein
MRLCADRAGKLRDQRGVGAVQFNHQSCVGAEEIHFHPPGAVEGNRKLSVQTKSHSRFVQSFQSEKNAENLLVNHDKALNGHVVVRTFG